MPLSNVKGSAPWLPLCCCHQQAPASPPPFAFLPHSFTAHTSRPSSTTVNSQPASMTPTKFPLSPLPLCFLPLATPPVLECPGRPSCSPPLSNNSTSEPTRSPRSPVVVKLGESVPKAVNFKSFLHYGDSPHRVPGSQITSLLSQGLEFALCFSESLFFLFVFLIQSVGRLGQNSSTWQAFWFS